MLMRRLIHLLPLLFFLLPLVSNAQTNIQQDWRVDSLLKQVDAKRPGLTMFGRKSDGDRFVNMAVLNDSTRTLTWFTCYGQMFDMVKLTDDVCNRIKSGTLDPFDHYGYYFFNRFSYIKAAAALFRQEGKAALKDTGSIYHGIYTYPPVRQAKSSLQKEVAMEKAMTDLYLQFSVFNTRTPQRLTPNDSFQLRLQLAGRMIHKGDTTIYYNTNPLLSAACIMLNKQVPGKMFVYDRHGQLSDSVPLKAGKYAALLNEKEDVFLLYRGWLELQSQQAIAAKEEVTRLLNREYTMLYKPVYWEGRKQQLKQTLLEVEEQVNAEGNKVMGLIVPAPEETAHLLAAVYQNKPAEISYLPGLGFAYSTAYIRGDKRYELTNHLGNIMAVVSDRRKAVDENNDGSVEYYNADVVSAVDYLPFGGQMQGRTYSGDDKYRYGFNGKENDSEVKGEGGQQDYGLRIYDTRIGRFLSMDMLYKDYPELTPYQFASNTPVRAVDLDGAEMKDAIEAGWGLNTAERRQDIRQRLAKRDGKEWLLAPAAVVTVATTATLGLSSSGMGIWTWYLNGGSKILGAAFGDATAAYGTGIGATGAGVAAHELAAREEALGADVAATASKSPNYSVGANPRNISSSARPIVVSNESYAITSESEILDSERRIIGTVSNFEGNLDLYINTKGTEYAGRGQDIFKALVEDATAKGTVTGINGTWSRGTLGSNLRTFNQAIQNGLSPERAAFETFTGSNARSLGFKNVTINRLEGNPGDYFSVSVTFQK